MVTINDIAREAGVSRGTVDRALHHRGRVAADKRARIFEIAERLGYQPNEIGRGLAVRKKHLKIGFIYVKSESAPFQRYIFEGARAYAEELEQYGTEVIFLPLLQERPEKERGIDILKGLIAERHFDGFAVMGTVAGKLEETLKVTGMEETPIVTFYMHDETEHALAYVGCDFRQAGRFAAGVASLMTNRRGKIATVIVDFKDLPSVSERVAGFREELRLYPDLEEVVCLVNDSCHVEEAFLEQVEAYLREHPELDLLWLVNPGDHAAIERMFALCEMYGVRLITNDLVAKADRELLIRSADAVSIDHDARTQGRMAIDLVFQYLAFGKLPTKQWFQSKLELKMSYNSDLA